MKKMTKLELEEFLNNPNLAQEVYQRLLGENNHELVQKPRLYFSSSPRGSKPIIPSPPFSVKVNTKELEKLGLNEEDFDFNPCEDDGYQDKESVYYRRDSFLTGGAVAAVIFEKLFGTPAVINDIDIFYYHFTAKNESEAEHYRYNNLSGEERLYYITEVKEVNKLNLIKIELEETSFSWQGVLESFDLNYSQVGMNLYHKKLVFTENFINFLQEKVIKVVPEYDTDHPLTTYLRAVHKAQDFQVRFYDREILRNFLIEYIPERAFQNDEDEEPMKIVSQSTHAPNENSEGDNESTVFVTDKRLDYWCNNPQCLPYLEPVKLPPNEDKNAPKAVLKINLPDEPWVELCRLVYASSPRHFYTRDFFIKLEKLVPNLWDIKPTMYRRLKAILLSNLLPWTQDNRYGQRSFPFITVLEANPRLLKEDFSNEKLGRLGEFISAHSNFLHELNQVLLTKGHSINSVLDVIQGLKTLDLNYLGILETIPLNETDRRNKPEYEAIIEMLHQKDIKGLDQALERIYRKQLEKNTLVFPEEKLPLGIFAKWVKEITRLDELEMEGKHMHHCVGGYGLKIKEGRSRILHLEINGNKSTLEIGIREETFINHKTHGKLNLDKKNQFLTKSQSQRATILERLGLHNDRGMRMGNSTIVMGSKDYHRVRHLAGDVLQQTRLDFNVRTVFSNAQHRARYNNNPSKANELLAKLIIRYLNNYLD